MEHAYFNGISVKRIKEHSFILNESLVKAETPFLSEIGVKFGFNISQEFIDITITAMYKYAASTEVLTEITVQNIFGVPDLKKYKKADAVIFPGFLITFFVALSVNHTRALLSKNLAGSALNDSNLPIMNAEEVAKHFFPLMFQGEDQPTPEVPIKRGLVPKRKLP